MKGARDIQCRLLLSTAAVQKSGAERAVFFHVAGDYIVRQR